MSQVRGVLLRLQRHLLSDKKPLIRIKKYTHHRLYTNTPKLNTFDFPFCHFRFSNASDLNPLMLKQSYKKEQTAGFAIF